MLLASEQIGMTVRLATVVVPVAVYFLILGLLNSRRHPQLLTGRLDFILMISALSPVFLLPAIDYVGASAPAVLGVLLALAAGMVLLAPGMGNWVVYNLPGDQARRAVKKALQDLGLDYYEQRGAVFRLTDEDAWLTVRPFPLLRNVTIRLHTEDRAMIRRFQGALSRVLGRSDAETTPAAVCFLLVATALLVAPASMMVHRVPEIVRLLTDLL